MCVFRAVRTICVLAAVNVAFLWGMSVSARAETLFFIAQPGQGGTTNFNWFSAGNWFVKEPDGDFVNAGRLPNENDVAELKTDVNVGGGPGNFVQVQGLFLEHGVNVHNGTLTVQDLTFGIGDGAGGTAPPGVLGVTNVTVTHQMHVVGGGTLAGTTLTIDGGAFAFIEGSMDLSNGAHIFNEGSLILAPNTVLTSFGADRIDILPGADLSANGDAVLSGGAAFTIDNRGAVKAKAAGTFRMGQGSGPSFNWISSTGTGDFEAAVAGAAIDFPNGFTIPSGVTFFFKGPGVSRISTGLNINGRLTVGKVDPATGVLHPGTFELAPNGFLAPTLSGSGKMRVRAKSPNFSTLNWLAGTVNTTGSVDIDPLAHLNIGGGAGTKTFTSGIINNGGVTAWTAGAIGFGTGATFNNLTGAMFDAQTDATLFGSSGCTFNNAGTFRKSAGTGITSFGTFGPDLNNTGLVNVKTGKVFLSGGTGTGRYNADPGTELRFAFRTQTLNAGATLTGTGLFKLAGGTLLLNPNLAVQNLEVNAGGVLDGPSTLEVRGLFTWTGGTLQGTGFLRVAAGAQCNVSGTDQKNLINRRLSNFGVLRQTSDIAGTDSVINNKIGATYEVKTNSGFLLTQGGGTVFNNAGLFEKTGGTGTSSFLNTFNNSGTVSVLAGTLRFPNYFQTAGNTDMNGGHLEFTNPANFNGGSLFGGGNITGSVKNNQGTLSPGHSPDLVTVSTDYTQAAGGVLTVQLGGLTAGSQFDQLKVNNAVNLGGTLKVEIINGFVPAAGHTFKILDKLNGGPPSGTYTGLPEGTTLLAGNRLFRINYAAGDGNDVVLTALLPTVSGRVFKFETMNGAVVKVGLANVTVKLGANRSALTAANGIYTFADVTAGSYIIQPQPPALNFEFNPPTRSVTVAGAVLTEQKFETYAISGRVTKMNNDGTRTGLAGAKITVNGAVRATTNANGLYSIVGLGDASYNVTAVLAGFSFPIKAVDLPTTDLPGLSPNANLGFLGTPVTEGNSSSNQY